MGRRETDIQLAAIVERLNQQDHMLERIFTQAAKTNGRLTQLELQEAIRVHDETRAQAIAVAQDGRSIRKIMVAAAAAGGMSSILGYIFLGIVHLHTG